MSGAVILVHMANPPAFFERRIYRNADGRNLNRVYPGRADGTQTERIAAGITREVIDKATHLVDMHCGDGNESLRPYSYWQVTGDTRLDQAGRELALAYGLDHIVIDRERPKDPGRSLYTANTAVLRGKPAITVESGGAGLTDEASVGAQEAGALSVIAHLGIQDLPSVRVEKPLYLDRAEVLTAPATGVWRWSVEKMQSVAEGTLIGRVHDAFGNPLAEVRAPFAGEVLYVVVTPPVSKGEPVAFVGSASAEGATPGTRRPDPRDP
jgi:predicted deacylase